MLTVFSNDMGEFLQELDLNSNAGGVERHEIRVIGERRLTAEPEIYVLVLICTYVCNGLLHRLEVSCGNIHPRDLNANKRTEERYKELHEGFVDIATNAALKMRSGLLEVRMVS